MREELIADSRHSLDLCLILDVAWNCILPAQCRTTRQGNDQHPNNQANRT